MTSYLNTSFDEQSQELADNYDDLPYWSISTGTLLLSLIKTGRHLKVLDIGFGTGFPLLVLSQRFGPTCQLYGQDQWNAALHKTQCKIEARKIQNVTLLNGDASLLQLPDNSVDLVTSNLGINNFDNPRQVIKECKRVLKPEGELILATNLQGTFRPFYEAFEACLLELQLKEDLKRLRAHLKKRYTIEDLTQLFIEEGFLLELAITDSANMYYTDGTAFLNDYFIAMSFMPSWKSIVQEGQRETVFELLEGKLNQWSAEEEELRLSVPIAAFKFSK